MGVLALLPYRLARLFNATLMAVVLCRAYRQVAPPEIAAILRPRPGRCPEAGPQRLA